MSALAFLPNHRSVVVQLLPGYLPAKKVAEPIREAPSVYICGNAVWEFLAGSVFQHVPHTTSGVRVGSSEITSKLSF